MISNQTHHLPRLKPPFRPSLTALLIKLARMVAFMATMGEWHLDLDLSAVVLAVTL